MAETALVTIEEAIIRYGLTMRLYLDERNDCLGEVQLRGFVGSTMIHTNSLFFAI